jgi:hypothetical protein
VSALLEAIRQWLMRRLRVKFRTFVLTADAGAFSLEGQLAALVRAGSPMNLTPPAITGATTVGQTLTVSNGTWSGSPTGYARQWRRGGAPITGATGANYTLVAGDAGSTISATVTATNTVGSTPATSAAVGPVVAAGDPSGLPLLYEANVTGSGRYLGSFRFPADPGFENPANWSGSIGYGAPGTTMWHKPGSGLGTLLVGGRAAAVNQVVSEITIPTTLSTTGATGSLPRASFAVGSASQRFFDVTNGNQAATAPGDSNGTVPGGICIYNGNIYFNTGSIYQGNVQTVATHFKRTGTSITSGTTTGPFAFAPAPLGFTVPSVNGNSTLPLYYRGVNCTVPAVWQSQIGGPMIVGQGQYSNNKPMGNGPYMMVYDPDDIGVVSPVPNEVLCSFDDDESFGGITKWIRSVSLTSGMAFPEGSGTVLVLAMIGTGTAEYGDVIGQGGSIYDPAVQAKGWHAWPYARSIMAFRAQDLADARNGLRAKDSVLPYSIWPIEMPGGAAIGAEPQDAARSAMAYDSATQRLYIVERETSRSIQDPIVHVYQMSF